MADEPVPEAPKPQTPINEIPKSRDAALAEVDEHRQAMAQLDQQAQQLQQQAAYHSGRILALDMWLSGDGNRASRRSVAKAKSPGGRAAAAKKAAPRKRPGK